MRDTVKIWLMFVAGLSSSLPAQTFTVRQHYADPIATKLVRIAVEPESKEIYLLDIENHRVVVVDANGKKLREFGQIGQGPADLFRPIAMAFSPKSELYLIDGQEIKVFNRHGVPVRHFPIGILSDSIALNSRSEVFLNAPRNGKLMTVYDRNGRELRRVGDLADLSEGFSGQSLPGASKEAISRALVCAGPDDAIYVAFQFMPVIRKYSNSGRLVWQRRMNGAPVDSLVRTFWRETGAARPLQTKNMDGIKLPVITAGIGISSRGNPVVALANTTIVALSADGGQVATLALAREGPATFLSAAMIGSQMYFATGRGCWRTTDLIF